MCLHWKVTIWICVKASESRIFYCKSGNYCVHLLLWSSKIFTDYDFYYCEAWSPRPILKYMVIFHFLKSTSFDVTDVYFKWRHTRYGLFLKQWWRRDKTRFQMRGSWWQKCIGILRQLETRRRSESYTYIYIWYNKISLNAFNIFWGLISKSIQVYRT
jgi:hypothetical protein